MYIPDWMQPVERNYTAQPERKVLNVAVAINLCGGVYVKELTGTDYTGCHRIQTYVNARVHVMRSMGAEEYTDFLGDAWEFLSQHKNLRRRMHSLVLVHDRNAVHCANAVKKWLEEEEVHAVLAPPRSPDLMPLDYSVFGTTKQAVKRQVGIKAAWDVRARTFLNLLREQSVEAIIGQFPKRLKACMAQQGGHFEGALRKQ